MNEDNMKIREEGYFAYLTREMINALVKSEDYSCKDFVALKLELLMNLHKIFESKEKFDEVIRNLYEHEKVKKYERVNYDNKRS